MSVKNLKEEVIKAIDTMSPELIALSRQIHANPESAYKEFKACQLLCEFLEKRNFKLERHFADLETAFRATAHGSKGSPVIAFMAEYDAIPGIGHGCGHNLSGMASVGAAVAVSTVLENVKGGVVVLGTPAEEGGGGQGEDSGKGGG